MHAVEIKMVTWLWLYKHCFHSIWVKWSRGVRPVVKESCPLNSRIWKTQSTIIRDFMSTSPPLTLRSAHSFTHTFCRLGGRRSVVTWPTMKTNGGKRGKQSHSCFYKDFFLPLPDFDRWARMESRCWTSFSALWPQGAPIPWWRRRTTPRLCIMSWTSSTRCCTTRGSWRTSGSIAKSACTNGCSFAFSSRTCSK